MLLPSDLAYAVIPSLCAETSLNCGQLPARLVCCGLLTHWGSLRKRLPGGGFAPSRHMLRAKSGLCGGWVGVSEEEEPEEEM